MNELTLTLPDKSIITAEKGTTLAEVLKSYKPGLNSVAAMLDNKDHDLSDTVQKDAEISFIEADSKKGLDIIRHSTSHIMAEAVKALFPDVKVAIGPSIESGFYYDFDYDRPFKEDDLSGIEEKMKEIIKANLPFVRKEISSREAVDFSRHRARITKSN